MFSVAIFMIVENFRSINTSHLFLRMNIKHIRRSQQLKRHEIWLQKATKNMSVESVMKTIWRHAHNHLY